MSRKAKDPVSVDPSKKEEKQSNDAQENCGMQTPRPEVGPDREVWVRNQVLTAIRMGLALHQNINVRADQTAYEEGVYGVALGATIEILDTLGFDVNKLVNIKKRLYL